MANVGSMVVSLVAKTGNFRKSMYKSRKTLNSFSSGIASVAKSVSRFAAVGLGVAATATTLLIRKQMQHIDVIAKLSDRIGVSTEFLSAYGHAAKITGTSQEEFNKAIEMFIRRLGEITQGTGEAKYGLEAIGLTVDDLIHRNPEEAFKIVAERIKTLGTQAEKAAVAYRFFGRSGSKMLNLLESNLEGVVKEAERLGITFNRIDAAKVEAANDAMTNLKAAISGLGQELAIKFAPTLQTVADMLTNAITGTESLGNTILTVFENASLAVAKFAEGSESKLRYLWERIQGLGLTLDVMTGFQKPEELEKWLDKVNKKDKSDEIRKFYANLRDNVAKNTLAAEQKAASTQNAFGTGPLFSDLEEQESQARKIEQMAKSLYEKTRTPLEKYESSLGDFSTLLKAGAIDWDTYGRAVRMAHEELGKYDDINKPGAISASAQEVRSQFIDVGGLSLGTNLESLNSQQLSEARKHTGLLRDIAGVEALQ